MSDQDLTVSALLARLGAVLAAADLDEIVVRGQLVGWQRRPAWASAEIVEHSLDGRRPLARIPIGMPGRHAAALEQQLPAFVPLSTSALLVSWKVVPPGNLG